MPTMACAVNHLPTHSITTSAHQYRPPKLASNDLPARDQEPSNSRFRQASFTAQASLKAQASQSPSFFSSKPPPLAARPSTPTRTRIPAAKSVTAARTPRCTAFLGPAALGIDGDLADRRTRRYTERCHASREERFSFGSIHGGGGGRSFNRSRGGRGAAAGTASPVVAASAAGAAGEFDCSEALADSGATSTSTSDSTSPDGAANTSNASAAAAALERDSVTRARRVRFLEDIIERTIFNFRFFTLMAVVGSLIGSALCFTKGCIFVAQSVKEFALFCWNGVGTGKVILLLVEAVDVYLIGTVMLIFGIGLYELFVNSLDVPSPVETAALSPAARAELSQRICGSSLFGLFRLKARPKWLEIHSLDEMKTKLGHVIVMILLVGMFEKSKKVPVASALDLLFFSASVCFAAGCLFLLSKLVGGTGSNGKGHK